MEHMEQIYREHAKTIYKFLMSQCHNEALAEELTQETFYQAVKSIDRFDGTCKISVWLCQIAKHLWYQFLQRNKREVPDHEADLDLAVSSAEEAFLSQESHVELLKQIHSLPDPAREVMYLRAFGGLSFRQIGDVLGKTEAWARVTFYRSKERLKGEFEHEN